MSQCPSSENKGKFTTQNFIDPSADGAPIPQSGHSRASTPADGFLARKSPSRRLAVNKHSTGFLILWLFPAYAWSQKCQTTNAHVAAITIKSTATSGPVRSSIARSSPCFRPQGVWTLIEH